MSGTNGKGKHDEGADSETRRRPCIKRTWCTLELDHEGNCVELPRAPIPRTDYGPRRSKR